MNKLIIFFLTFISLTVQAKLALYEIGLASGGGYITDYPASNEKRFRNITVPSFRYRGKILKSDRRGTRAQFFETERSNIDLSFGASFPASSSQNKAREGMEDLDWLGEIGPRYNLTLYKHNRKRIEIQFPLRTVFSTDFTFTKYRGLRFYPQIDFEHFLTEKIRINMSFKMNWVTEELADYFYEIKPSEVTSERNVFNAKGGFVGHNVNFFITYGDNELFTLFGVRLSDYSKSTNHNSDLHKANSDTAIFLAINYYFFQSKERAP